VWRRDGIARNMKPQNTMPEHGGRARPAAKIVDFKTAQRREMARRRALEGYVPETPEQMRLRLWQNLSAALVVIALVAGGIWLIVHLRDGLKMEACVESGRRNCAPIDTTQPPKP